MATSWYPSRWGADDQLGAMNLISPESIVSAFRLVDRGIIYDLSYTLECTMPVPGIHGQFFANTHYTLASAAEWHDQHLGRATNGISAQNLRISMSDHTGTHIDSLNHVGVQDKDGDFLLYNGVRASEVISGFGTKRLGIETMPALICRGVLADVAGSQNVEMLPVGYVISPAEIDKALDEEGVTVRAGDAVLVHTGWGKTWDDQEKALSGEPGLGKACAAWAIEKDIVCWGIDQSGTDPIPFETPGEALPMHLEMLIKAGIRLIENIRMDDIVDDGVYEFCLIAAPLKIKGGTGSPIRLLAVV